MKKGKNVGFLTYLGEDERSGTCYIAHCSQFPDKPNYLKAIAGMLCFTVLRVVPHKPAVPSQTCAFNLSNNNHSFTGGTTCLAGLELVMGYQL